MPGQIGHMVPLIKRDKPITSCPSGDERNFQLSVEAVRSLSLCRLVGKGEDRGYTLGTWWGLGGGGRKSTQAPELEPMIGN